VKVIKIEFAKKPDLEKKDFKEINEELKESAWSRRWEYPFVILNSKSTEFSKILIAGCKGDKLVDYFLKRKRTIFGVDVSYMAKKNDNFHFYRGDLRNLPYPNGNMDEIFCISTLEHITDNPMVGIIEFCRVLKKGGQLILTIDYNQDPASSRRFKTKELKQLCSDLNTKIPEIPKDVLGRKQWPGLSALGIIIVKE